MDKHEIFCDCGVKMEFPLQEWGCSDKNPEGFPTYEQAKEVAVERWNERESEPVRRGEWVISESPAHLSTIKCSECGTMYQRRWKAYCNFCPECGAKMDMKAPDSKTCVTCEHNGWGMPQCRECKPENGFKWYIAKAGE